MGSTGRSWGSQITHTISMVDLFQTVRRITFFFVNSPVWLPVFYLYLFLIALARLACFVPGDFL